MQPLFKECMDKLEGSIVYGPQQATDAETNQKPICFHLPFHPRGIQCHHIRRYCATALAPLLPERRLTAAISWDYNIQDWLCQARLVPVKGNNPSNFMSIKKS